MATSKIEFTVTDGNQTRKDNLDFDKLYTFYDRHKKAIPDFLREYQQVSNYNYHKSAGNTLDYRYRLMDLYDYSMLDLHLTSIVDSLYHQIIGERYFFRNPDGSTNKEIVNPSELVYHSSFIWALTGTPKYSDPSRSSITSIVPNVSGVNMSL